MLTKTAGDDSAISFLQFDLSDLQGRSDRQSAAVSGHPCAAVGICA